MKGRRSAVLSLLRLRRKVEREDMIEVGSWKERMEGLLYISSARASEKGPQFLRLGWFSLQGHDIEDLYTQNRSLLVLQITSTLGMTVQISIITSPRSSPTPLFLANRVQQSIMLGTSIEPYTGRPRTSCPLRQTPALESTARNLL